MLIRIRGGSEGIAEYLITGQKQDREFGRDELDKRLILSGDLQLTDTIIKSMDGDSQRYLHITLSFKEEAVEESVLLAITQDFKDFALASYEDDELNFYAEAHLPRIKTYKHAKTGELIERKPHIHIVIPQKNLLTGERAHPFGLVDNQVKFLSAFQEMVNNKYGLASPLDNRRTEMNMGSELISRHKGDLFSGKTKDLKTGLLDQILQGISDYTDFKSALKSHGEVRIRNKGKENEYLNLKLPGDQKGINLKEDVFREKFLNMVSRDRTAYIGKQLSEKYISTTEPRRDSATIVSALQEWREIRSREIKYINSGNRKFYSEYKKSTSDEKRSLLDERERKFYQKHKQEFGNDRPTDIINDLRAATNHLREVERNLGAAKRNIDAAKRFNVHSERARANFIDRRIGDGISAAVESIVGKYQRNKNRTEPKLTNAKGINNAKLDTAPVRSRRPPPPWARGRLLHVRELRVVHPAGKTGGDPDRNRLLRDPVRGSVDNERTVRHRRLQPLQSGRDNRISQALNALAERAGRSAQQDTLQTLERLGSGRRLLAYLAKSHGVVAGKFSVEKGAHGEDRIKTGTRSLGLSDFLTKEINISLADSIKILAAVSSDRGDGGNRVSKNQYDELWRDYKVWRDEGKAARNEEWRLHLAAEKNARIERGQRHKNKMAEIAQNSMLSRGEKRAARSILRTARVIDERGRKDAAQDARGALQALFSESVREQFPNFLRERAQAGNAAALAALRWERTAESRPSVGIIRPFRDEEMGTTLYLAKMRYEVQRDGSVIYSDDSGPVLRDLGTRVEVLQWTSAGIEAGLLLAVARFGGNLSVEGPQAFREAAARVSGRAGVGARFGDSNLDGIVDFEGRLRITQDEARALARAFGENTVKRGGDGHDNRENTPDRGDVQIDTDDGDLTIER